MYRLAVLAVLVAAVTCQQHEGGRRVPKYAGDPKTAAILQEARYLNGNGAFAIPTLTPSGQRKTVNYIAGKNGFQAIGDHIPTAPQPVAPTPGYQPDPRYNSPDYKAPQYSAPQQYTAPCSCSELWRKAR
ncbi:hypothetical protein ACJJTC_006233 [Scirpophaga incertulas]